MIKIKLILENVSENIIAKESIKIACFLRLEYKLLDCIFNLIRRGTTNINMTEISR